MSQQRISQPIRGWAVLIGINNYTDQFTHPPLRCCVRDAIGLYVILTHPNYSNFQPEHVLLLLDGTDDEIRRAAQAVVQKLEQDYHFSARLGIVGEIVGKRLLPQRETILAEIHRAAHNANPEDLLLVHFAGHGYIFDGEMYLVPPLYFWTAILLRWVKEGLQQSRAQHKVLLPDALKWTKKFGVHYTCFSCPPTDTISPSTNGLHCGTSNPALETGRMGAFNLRGGFGAQPFEYLIERALDLSLRLFEILEGRPVAVTESLATEPTPPDITHLLAFGGVAAVVSYLRNRCSKAWALPGERRCLGYSTYSLPLTFQLFQRSAAEHRNVVGRPL